MLCSERSLVCIMYEPCFANQAGVSMYFLNTCFIQRNFKPVTGWGKATENATIENFVCTYWWRGGWDGGFPEDNGLGLRIMGIFLG